MRRQRVIPSGILSVFLLLMLVVPRTACAQTQVSADSSNQFLTVGLFIASIEEGARIFTPVRFLPFDHPESKGHQFPTVEQFHDGEDRLLVSLGHCAGLLLQMTLQRYPVEPDTTWPYSPFRRPPAYLFDSLKPVHKPASESPLPGLRAAAYLGKFPLGFIIDTRGMTLADRHMTRTTSSGLDVTRAQVLAALATAAQAGPAIGAWVVVYDRP